MCDYYFIIVNLGFTFLLSFLKFAMFYLILNIDLSSSYFLFPWFHFIKNNEYDLYESINELEILQYFALLLPGINTAVCGKHM